MTAIGAVNSAANSGLLAQFKNFQSAQRSGGGTLAKFSNHINNSVGSKLDFTV